MLSAVQEPVAGVKFFIVSLLCWRVWLLSTWAIMHGRQGRRRDGAIFLKFILDSETWILDLDLELLTWILDLDLELLSWISDLNSDFGLWTRILDLDSEL